MSKGSGLRPSQVSKEEFESNWDKIFGKKEVASTKKEDDKSKCKNCATCTKNKPVEYIAHHQV